MRDDAIHEAAATAAIAILLILAFMIRNRALFPRRTLISQNMTPHDQRRRLNTPVNLVPLSGAHLQQVNSGRDGVQLHQRRLVHHVPPVHSVASLRPPPPAYPAHHLDVRFDLVGSGHYSIGNSGGTVDVVLPPYTADPGGDGQPL